MKALLKFSTIAILLIILIGIVVVGIIGHEVYSGKGVALTFINNSGQSADSVVIAVSGQSCSANGLERGGKFSCRIENLSDSGYNVQVKLRSGSTFSVKDFGYVTGGMESVEEITINENGEIKFSSGAGT